MISVIQKAATRFGSDECLTLAASLAYYTLFAMPPLLFLLVTIVAVGMSTAFEQERAEAKAQEFLQQQASQLLGNEAAAAEVGKIIENTRKQTGTWWKSLLSLAGVLVGATGLVGALQASLNRVWKVKPGDGRLAVQFLMKRLVSLAMILGFGFLLLVSFAVATGLRFLTDYATHSFGLTGNLPQLVNQTVSFFTTWTFFAAMFRFMPDAEVPWKHAILGGLFTVILFSLGRLILFYYLSTNNHDAHLGSAAGALVVILLWVYYSSIILLFGAEFTASLDDRPAVPETGAVRIRVDVPVDISPANTAQAR